MRLMQKERDTAGRYRQTDKQIDRQIEPHTDTESCQRYVFC